MGFCLCGLLLKRIMMRAYCVDWIKSDFLRQYNRPLVLHYPTGWFAGFQKVQTGYEHSSWPQPCIFGTSHLAGCLSCTGRMLSCLSCGVFVTDIYQKDVHRESLSSGSSLPGFFRSRFYPHLAGKKAGGKMIGVDFFSYSFCDDSLECASTVDVG